MKTLKSHFILSAITGLTLLTACANNAATPTPNPIGGKVSLYVSADPIEAKAYGDIVAAFNKNNPKAEIELINVPNGGDYRKRLAADFAAGAPADIFFLNYRFLLIFV